jgi:hypothetical protein
MIILESIFKFNLQEEGPIKSLMDKNHRYFPLSFTTCAIISFLFCFVETGSHSVTQAGLEFTM